MSIALVNDKDFVVGNSAQGVANACFERRRPWHQSSAFCGD